MELNKLTVYYLGKISELTSLSDIINYNNDVQIEVVESLVEKGYLLNNNYSLSELFEFRRDLKFIESGLLNSWKDDLTNDYRQKYYFLLQKKVQDIIDSTK